MYNLEGIKIEIIVNGKIVKYNVPLDYYHVTYEDLFSLLLEIVHSGANYLDEEIYDSIDSPPGAGGDIYD